MKEDFRKVLQNLLQIFSQSKADLDIIQAKLQVKNTFDRDECDLIQNEKTTTAKFIVS